MEVEDAMIIEDLDPKHSLKCKISRETVKSWDFRECRIGIRVVQTQSHRKCMEFAQ